MWQTAREGRDHAPGNPCVHHNAGKEGGGYRCEPVRRFDAEDDLPGRRPRDDGSVPAAAATELEFDGRHARAEPAGDGGYRLHAAGQALRIAPQPMRSDTGSVLFDALFALAQQELDANRVEAIRDPAFDDGQPVPCECFQTGARWPYVWTRGTMSFAADLALARVDPVRTRHSLRF